jgi:hypothetical protein
MIGYGDWRRIFSARSRDSPMMSDTEEPMIDQTIVTEGTTMARMRAAPKMQRVCGEKSEDA